ncbi:hypothetical protein BDR26DRAFT_30932 [Obelidium mucronatum]|nr:hypothetical protein BDR26DRAFT_30932 [Obelidium mucronatum]
MQASNDKGYNQQPQYQQPPGAPQGYQGQQQMYPPQQQPQVVYVQQQAQPEKKDRGCCLGCLAAICFCCVIDEMCECLLCCCECC